MAKHRTPNKRRARKTLVAAAAAASLSGTLALGHATNVTAENLLVRLADATHTVIGAGGLGDNLGERVPAKLSSTVVPPGYTYVPLQYDSTINLGASRDAGTILLNQAIGDHGGAGTKTIGVGYSAGTLAMEKERRDLQALPAAQAPTNDQLSFLLIASPFIPNGGIFGRFPAGFTIPGVVDFMGPGQVTRYDTTYVANEYDPYADFPAYFNPLALVNTALAVRYAHPDEYYDAIDPLVTPHYTTQVHNLATGSTDTYTLYLNPQLPLLGPLRELAGLIPLGTPLTEPVLSAFEPLLRVMVDMGYTDRQNLDPATHTPFSLITPPAKLIEAAGAVPGALIQGVGNLLSGGQAALTLQSTSLSTLSTPAPASGGNSPQLRMASVQPSTSAADVTSKPSDTQTANTGKTKPTEQVQKDDEDITHPTLTSDGSKSVPTTTATGTAPAGSQPAVTTTTATGSVVGEKDSPTTVTDATPASGTTPATGTTAGASTPNASPGAGTTGGESHDAAA